MSPRGEQLVFKILKEHPSTADWTVLHSFNLPVHEVRRRGEIDFLIFIPGKGIISLEVKSHDYIARIDGNWVYGNEPPTRRSPFEQAQAGMYTFQKRLGMLGTGIPFLSVVAFTNTRFAEPAAEWDEWQVIDKASMKPDDFVEKLVNAAEQNLKELLEMKSDPARRGSVNWFRPNDESPSSETISRIANTVRGDFEIHVDPRDLHLEREAEYKSFLEEQFEAIDAMANDQRILFEGAAGTGKTLLAVEECRRSQSRNETTLFLCFNRLLGDFIRREISDEMGFRGTLHSFVQQNIALSSFGNPENSDDFNRLAQVMEEQKLFVDQFDNIIIDEVQDFCSRGAVEFLQTILKQNSNAKVRMFGDFENQSVHLGETMAREDFIRKFSELRTYRLTRNCRNRPGIGSAIEIYTKKSGLYLGFRLPATLNNLKNCPADSPDAALKRCESEFLRLSRTFLPSEIVILGMEHEVAIEDLPSNFAQSLTNRHTTWKSDGSRVLSTTVRKFKGLDAQAVILTNLSETIDIDLLYTGMSRAIEEIVIIGPQVVLAGIVGIPSS